MSWRLFSCILAGAVLFGGCSYLNPAPAPVKPRVAEANVSSLPQCTMRFEKADFPMENEYIMHALVYAQEGKLPEARAIYEELYDRTGNLVYRMEAVKILMQGRAFDMAEGAIDDAIQRHGTCERLYQLKTVNHISMKNDAAAYEDMQVLLAIDPDDFRNVDLAASVFRLRDEPDRAMQLYRNYYERRHDETSLLKMATLYWLDMRQPKEAIRLLETHSRMFGCTQDVCLALANYYRSSRDWDGLKSVDLRLYETFGKSEYALDAAKIAIFQKEYAQAAEILDESRADDATLLSLYKQTGAFDKAYRLAEEMYDRTLEAKWLAECGVLLYEKSSGRDDPKLLGKVRKMLSEAIERGADEALYLNYLGYLLIDHDIDVPEGLKYVKQALALEPDSPFYIDSLAWGNYKLGNCRKAHSLMQRVIDKLGLEDEEVKVHWQAIQECLKEKRDTR